MDEKLSLCGIILFTLSMCFTTGCALFGGGNTSAPDGGNQNDPVARGDYFFDGDAKNGGDGSYASPFNSLETLNDLTLSAGQTVCLTGKLKGNLYLNDLHGTAEEPITITVYNGGAVLDGAGYQAEERGIVTVHNSSYVTLQGLEITDSSRAVGVQKRGVLVSADGGESVTTYAGITLKQLNIHDIYGTLDDNHKGMSVDSKKTGGIQVWTNDGYGRFDGLSIEDCEIENVDNAGISLWYRPGTSAEYKNSPYGENFATHAYSNVKIKNNRIGNVGKNCIFARNLSGGVIEDNVVYNNCNKCFSGNAICTSYVDGTVVQRNEGYGNNARADSEGKMEDGCMLDADLQSKDTIWQYNYSHDNSFGLFMACTDVRDNVTVRYNLSVADRGNMGIIYLNYDGNRVDVYNNTIVTTADTAPYILRTNKNHSRIFNFYNNIIYNCSSGAKCTAVIDEEGDNYVFNNGAGAISYRDNGDITSSVMEEKMISPAFVSTIPVEAKDRIGIQAAQFAKLKPSSPALNSGRAVSGVEKDFFGNTYARSVGCCSRG